MSEGSCSVRIRVLAVYAQICWDALLAAFAGTVGYHYFVKIIYRKY